jgi:hypothetical protein
MPERVSETSEKGISVKGIDRMVFSVVSELWQIHYNKGDISCTKVFPWSLQEEPFP